MPRQALTAYGAYRHVFRRKSPLPQARQEHLYGYGGAGPGHPEQRLHDTHAVVKNFELERYLGQWYEIARFDHSFERGLSRVTAEYSVIDAETVRVLNRGYDAQAGEWQAREGRAKFVGAKDVGSLKVSFFGPFYGGYHILALDEDYQYALVSGPNRNYLWILARTPELDPATYDELVAIAAGFDFDTSGLLLVDQSPIPGE